MFKLIQHKSRRKVKEESKVLKDPTAMIHWPFKFYALKFIYNRFLDENNPQSPQPLLKNFQRIG